MLSLVICPIEIWPQAALWILSTFMGFYNFAAALLINISIINVFLIFHICGPRLWDFRSLPFQNQEVEWMNCRAPPHTPHAHTHAGNCISTTQLPIIFIFLPIPAELQLGGTRRREFLKSQSNLEKPLITSRAFHYHSFAPVFVASTHLFSSSFSSYNWLEDTNFAPAF